MVQRRWLFTAVFDFGVYFLDFVLFNVIADLVVAVTRVYLR